MTEENVHYVFWTGGWDSTYRVVELSRRPVTIRPVYVREPTRKSAHLELRAMERISSNLAARPGTRASLEPVTVVDYESLPVDEAVSRSYAAMCERVRLGSQYEYLARAALAHPGIELGAIRPNGEYSGVSQAIAEFGRLVEAPGGGAFWTRRARLRTA